MSIAYLEFVNKVSRDIPKIQELWKKNEASKTNQYPYNYQGMNTKSTALAKELEAMKGKNVIDIGCNSGLYSYLMGNVADSVLGCDIDQQFLNRSECVRSYFDTCYDTRNVSFFHGNFADKLTPNITGILACCVLYHIGDDNVTKLVEFLSNSNATIIIQSRPQRGEAFKKNPNWGVVSNTKLYNGIYTMESNLDFLRACGYEKVEVIGLQSTKFYSEVFPIIVAKK